MNIGLIHIGIIMINEQKKKKNYTNYEFEYITEMILVLFLFF